MVCYCPAHHNTVFCVFIVVLYSTVCVSLAFASEQSDTSNNHRENLSRKVARGFVQQIFNKYSHHDRYITFEDLEHLLINLGLSSSKEHGTQQDSENEHLEEQPDYETPQPEDSTHIGHHDHTDHEGYHEAHHMTHESHQGEDQTGVYIEMVQGVSSIWTSV